MVATATKLKEQTGTDHSITSIEPNSESVRSSSSATSGSEQTLATITDISEWKETKSAASVQQPSEQFTPALRTQLDTDGMRVLRSHYAEKLLEDLIQLREHYGEHESAIYAGSLMKTVLHFRDKSPLDPYLEILMAFYDSLAFQNQWVKYNASQYKMAFDILRNYADQSLDNAKIRKALAKLTGAGFDTLPFEVSFDETEDIDEKE